MNLRESAAKAAGIAALAASSVSPAFCQTQGGTGLSALPEAHYSSIDLGARGGDRGTWGTLALVSGIVLIFGLVDDDPTLTILGGVGLLFSLYETGQFGYRYGLYNRSALVHTGGISFGLDRNNQLGPTPGYTPRPTAYVQWNVKL